MANPLQNDAEMPQADNKPPLVLVVDDDPGVRRFLRAVLESDGYDVLAVEDGIEASRAIRELSPDIIVTDLFMPDLDGFELLRETLERNPGARVLAISGAFGTGLLEAAHKLGAAETLAKPFSPDELLLTVRRMLRNC